MSKPKSYKNAAKQALFNEVKEALVAEVVAAGRWSGYREHVLKAAVEAVLGKKISKAMFDFALRDSWKYDETISSFGNPGNWSYFPKKDAALVAVDAGGNLTKIA